MVPSQQNSFPLFILLMFRCCVFQYLCLKEGAEPARHAADLRSGSSPPSPPLPPPVSVPGSAPTPHTHTHWRGQPCSPGPRTHPQWGPGKGAGAWISFTSGAWSLPHAGTVLSSSQVNPSSPLSPSEGTDKSLTGPERRSDWPAPLLLKGPQPGSRALSTVL